MKFEDAVKRFCEGLKNDESIFDGYQANIAMSFYDEYRRQKSNKKYLNNNDILIISNEAATNFLNRLIKR